MATTTVNVSLLKTGYDSDTVHANTCTGGTFDAIGGTIYTGSKRVSATSTETYYQAGTEWNFSGVTLPAYAVVTAATYKCYLWSQGTRVATSKPYIYPLDWGTSWTTSDKMTQAQLQSVVPLGTKSILTSEGTGWYEWTLTAAAVAQIVARLGTSTKYRWIHADNKNETCSLPSGEFEYWQMSNASIIITYEIDHPTPLPIMLGSNF